MSRTTLAEPSLTTFLAGTGEVRRDDDGATLTLPSARRDVYSDAQLQDYAGLPRSAYPWRPPLHLSIQARFSPSLAGTAGFGFWNNPVSARGLPALPRAAWFFWTSPPSAIELAQDIPGHGWKAATLDSTTPRALCWGPFAPVVLLLCRHDGIRRRIWPRVQRALGIEERLIGAALPAFDHTAWHTYDLYWFRRRVIFGVDGHMLLTTAAAPRGPMGLVLWVDNQWARVTPTGSFGGGLLDAPAPQWLEYRALRIRTLESL